MDERATRWGRLVCAKYEQLGFRLHRKCEWTVLAGIVQIQDEEGKANKVVSLGTGLKCLPLVAYSTEQLRHQLVRDMHAEVLARRGLLAYLRREMGRAREDSSSVIVRDATTGLFRLREGIRFVMYMSQAPCGDASMHMLPPHATSDQSAALEMASQEKRPRVVRGRSEVTQRGLRTKPGRADALPAACLSCTDKIALWTCLGWQGALLSELAGPVIIDEFVIGERFSLEQCEAAISQRTRAAGASTPLMFHGIRDDLFRYGRRRVLETEAAGEEARLVAASVAQVWHEGGVAETLVEGRRLGAAKPKNGRLPLKSRSSLCTQALAGEENDVRTRKQANEAYQRQKAELLADNGVFEGWLVSDPTMASHRSTLLATNSRVIPDTSKR